jgi:hypothetical protein
VAEADRGQRLLAPETAARAFGDAYFNLIRRGADGSLKLSTDHWRLDSFVEASFTSLPAKRRRRRLP